MSTKFTVNLPDDTVSALRHIAEQRGITMTEALRQAIASEQFLQEEIQQGSKILIEKPGEPRSRLVFR